MEKLLLQIEGMHCSHCAASVASALKAVDGVKKAVVRLKKMTAAVQWTGGDVALLKGAVERAGFSASVLKP